MSFDREKIFKEKALLWLCGRLSGDELRLKDIPKEVRWSDSKLHITALSASRLISIKRIVQDLRIMCFDIWAMGGNNPVGDELIVILAKYADEYKDNPEFNDLWISIDSRVKKKLSEYLKKGLQKQRKCGTVSVSTFYWVMDTWLFDILLSDEIRINDIPREMRVLNESLYIPAFRLSRNKDVFPFERFKSDVLLLCGDIRSVGIEQARELRLIEQLGDCLNFNDFKGDDEFVSFQNSLDANLLQAVYGQEEIARNNILNALETKRYEEKNGGSRKAKWFRRKRKKGNFRGYNWRYEKKYKLLRNIIKPCYQFDEMDKEYDEETAKQILIRFFCEFAKIKPSQELNFGLRGEYYSFFINMIPLQAALSSKNYSLACHELITLHGYEPILQKRIYNNLMLLYQKYLEE